MWPTVRQSAIETLQHFSFIKLLYNFSDDMNRCALNSQGGPKVPVLRHFLKRMPKAFHTLFLCAIPILLLVPLGFPNTAFARDPLIAYSQNGASVNNFHLLYPVPVGKLDDRSPGVSPIPSGDFDGRWQDGQDASITAEPGRQWYWKTGDRVAEERCKPPSGTVPTGITEKEVHSEM